MSIYRKICNNAGTVGLFIILLLANGIMSFALTLENNSSIIISLDTENDDMSNVEFNLYKIADYDNGIYSLTEFYEKYEKKILYLDGNLKSYYKGNSEILSSLTQSLSLYSDMDGIIPLEKELTNENGKCVFGELEKGIYLIKGQKYIKDEKMYIPQSCIVYIGEDSGKKNDDQYNIAIKSDCRILDGKNMSLMVMKEWKDSENRQCRPNHVGMVLMKDGVVCSKVELSEKNSWKSTWNDLDKRYVWTAAEEEISDGYVCSPKVTGNTFVMSNILTEKKQYHEADSEDVNKGGAKLPQTGVIWKCIIGLYAGGILITAAGIRIYEKKKKNTCLKETNTFKN